MPSYILGSGLPDLPSGLTDKEAALVTPLYRAINGIAAQLSKQTGNIQYSQSELSQIDQLSGLTPQLTQKLHVKALETISYGQLVTLSLDAGKFAVRPAKYDDAAKPAHGLCDLPSGIATGAYGTIVFMQGRCTGVSGTTVGAVYYLSAAGVMQITKPVGVGQFAQIVAVGLGSAGVYLNIVPWGNI